MRADRLLSILMLLKSRGRLNASELAEELEVSERTIYRDMDVLSSAHFPVYAEKGLHGGYALLPDYDLDLSGFNDRDVQALAALNIPEPFFEIGLGSGLKTALSKLLSVLSVDLHAVKNWQQNRFIIEPSTFETSTETGSNLTILQKAVWQDRCISCKIIYPVHFGISDPITLAPHTLIAAHGKWYLICQRKNFYRIFPLSQLADIKLTTTAFKRTEDYDAASLWKKWLSDRNQNAPHYPVVLEIQQSMLRYFSARYGIPFQIRDEKESREGWKVLLVDFDELEQARRIVLGLGSAVRILKPNALRLSARDYALQFLKNHNDP